MYGCFGSTRSQVRILSPRLESQRIAKAVAPILRRLLKAVYVCPDPLPRKGLARIGVGCRFRSSEVLSPRAIDSPSNSFPLAGYKKEMTVRDSAAVPSPLEEGTSAEDLESRQGSLQINQLQGVKGINQVGEDRPHWLDSLT